MTEEPRERTPRHRVLRAVWRSVVLIAVARGSARKRGDRPTPPAAATPSDPSTREIVASASAEYLVAGLLIATMAAGVGFAALLILDHNTQLLALTLGGVLAFFGTGLAVAGARVVPQVTAAEQRPMYDRDTSASDEVAQRLRDGVEGVTRRRMLATAGAAALTGLAAAAVAPLIALGPGLTNALK
ncbi:MAG: hypothetical protein ACRDLP_15450, partial [Solirubrobacteraceae bacterium]